ncbi:MAG: hypothetical protein DCC73_15065 [Proteobacteria bacterium]|nr:MAG: hypothetical protein DCC73_15065 [Pseudomonadota bacterium]
MSKVLKAVVKFTVGTILVAVGLVTGQVWLMYAGMSMQLAGIFDVALVAAKAVGLIKTPKMNSAIYERLQKQITPTAARKICFGETAFGVDVRFSEKYSGDDRYVEVIACASHKVQSIDKIYFDDALTWTSGGGLQGKYAAGIVSVTVRTEGSAANSFALGSGAYWTTTCRMTGLAYVAIVYKLSAKKWPEGIPTRATIIGKGCPVYDPRLDSTNGGSGSHRPNDQTTWAYTAGSVAIGKNPALQLLTYLIGWKINGKLAWGMGVPATRINFASFIAYANLCEESVALLAGGTVQRYESSLIDSTASAHEAIIAALEAAMGTTKLTDVDGLYQLVGGFDDTAGPKIAFSADDLMGPYQWTPSPPSRERFNVARGRFPDPVKLYQLNDWPEVAVDPLADGIPRTRALDFAAVPRAETCQRIVKQMLLRNQYPGQFVGVFGPRAFLCAVGSLVTISLPDEGWNNKLFRVADQTESHDLVFQMTLVEEAAAIYAWDKEEKPMPADISPPGYDPTATRTPAAFDADVRQVAGPNSTTIFYVDVTWTAETSEVVAGIEIQAKPSTDAVYTALTEGLFDAAVGVFTVTAGESGVTLDVRGRYRMLSGVYGAWATTSVVIPAAPNIAAGFVGQGDLATQDNVDWASQVAGTGKPENNAQVNPADTNNLIRNTAFAGGSTTGWTTDETVTLAHDITALTNAPTKYGIRYTTAGANGHTYPLGSNINPAGTDAIPVAAGEKFYLEGWGYRDGSANGHISLYVRWYDKTGAHLSYSEVVLLNSTTVPSTNTFTKVSGTVTAPANAAYAYVLWSNRTDHTTGTWYGALAKISRYQPGADITSENTSADTSTVAGVPAKQILLSQTEIFETFANYTSVSEIPWTITGSANCALVTTTDSGGKALRCGNNSGNDEVTAICNQALDFTPEDLWMAEVDIEVEFSSSGFMYFGVKAEDNAGANLTSHNGTYHYQAGSGEAMNFTGRKKYVGYIRGHVGADTNSGYRAATPNDPKPLANNTVRMKPLFIANYNGQAGQVLIHSFRLRKIVDATPNYRGAWSSSVTYYKDDAVDYQGRRFMALVKHTNTTPPTSETSTSTWLYIGLQPADALATRGAPNGTYVDGVPAQDIANQAGVLFRETFDKETDQASVLTRWTSHSGSGEISVVSGTGAVTGGKYIEIGNNSGNDQRWLISKTLIPYDPNKLHRIKVRLSRTAGTGTVYIGIAGFAYDKASLVNTAGANDFSSQHYIAAANYAPGSSFEVVTGYFKGTAATGDGTVHSDPASPAVLHQNVRYIAALLLVNYNGVAGTARIEEVLIETVPDAFVGTLSGDVQIAQSPTVLRVLTRGYAEGVARDGDSFTFNPAWSDADLPRVKFGGGGKTFESSFTGHQGQEFSAIGLSSTGFTASLKLKDLSGTATAYTETGQVAGSGGRTYEMNMDTANAAFDLKYEYDFDVKVLNQYIGGGSYLSGSVTVGFWNNDGSGWVRRATNVYNGSIASSFVTWSNRKFTVTLAGMDLNDDFGISVESSTYGGSILAFNAVRWTYLTGAGSTVSATPDTLAAIEFSVVAGNSGGLE